MAYATLKNKKRVTVMLIIALVGFLLVIGRLFYVQIIKGNYYKEKAYMQQTKDRTVKASRGTIYDSKGNKLALSVSANTLSVAPTNIKKEDKEKIAKDAKCCGFTDYMFADTFEEAVLTAAKLAEPGEAVLLSPACASWDMFSSYEVRGEKFKEIVNSL